MKIDNIFLIGPMGAGKTSVGRFLAKHLNKNFYDSDEEIEKQTGVNLSWIFDLEGEEGFRQREMKVICTLAQLTNIVLSTGGGCVKTPGVRECLQGRGTIIYMQVSLAMQLSRLKHDKRRPLLQGGDPQEILVKLWAEREIYCRQLADFTVLTDDRSIRDVCDDILIWLRQKEKEG
jgi:shikimate kinase